jgi:hypothetical protein
LRLDFSALHVKKAAKEARGKEKKGKASHGRVCH